MPTNPPDSITYFGKNDKWILEKFDPDEIALFFKKGITFFEYLKETPESIQFLSDNPVFAELIERW